jgi:hypothetical protein
MHSEPSIKTGLIILTTGILTVIVGFFLYNLPIESLESLTTLLQIATTLYTDVGPGIVGWAIGWITSALNPLRKYYLIPVSAGTIMPMVTFSFGSPLISAGFVGSNLWYMLTFSIPPALISSGILSGVVITRHARRDKLPRVHPSFEEYLLYIVALSLLLPFIREPPALLRLVASVIGCWIIWHFLSPKIAYYSITRKIKKSGGKLELVSAGGILEEELTFSNVFSRAYYPLAFGLGVSLTLFDIIELTPLSESILTSEPLIKTAQIVLISLLAITAGSSYVGPVLWLFQDSNIRIKDNVRMTIEEPKIHSLANQMVEIYTFIQAPICFTIAAAGGDYMYAFALLILLLITVLTVAFPTVILYVKFSSRSNLYRLIEKLLNEGYLKPAT